MAIEESVAAYGIRIKPLLNSFVNSRRNRAAEAHLDKLFWFYSYVIEDFEDKITKNKELCRSFFPMLIEAQDILRGTLFCQEKNLLATAALNLRTIFEIYINAKFIFRSPDPKKYLERLVAFTRCEELVGQKFSPAMVDPPKEVEENFVKQHPYWAKKEGGLKETPIWNGDDKSLKTICKEFKTCEGLEACGSLRPCKTQEDCENLKTEGDYYRIYKPTSKFVHGSPVVRNLYKKGDSIGSVPQQKYSTQMCLLTSELVHRLIKESCQFFGVPVPIAESKTIKDEFEALGEIVTGQN